MKKRSNAEITAEFTDRILSLMETEGKLIWQKNWRSAGWPTNLATGKPYTGGNVLALMVTAAARNYTTNFWVGFGQAKDLAVQAAKAEGRNIIKKSGRRGSYYWDADANELFRDGVKKGEKATDIIRWAPFVAEQCDTAKGLQGRDLLSHADDCEDCKIAFRCSFLKVFNLDQTTLEAPERETLDFQPVEAAQRIVDGFFAADGAPSFSHGGGRAFYAPTADAITVPAQKDFQSVSSYYVTTFHEMAHSTGHESRLNREELATMIHFGDARYCEEELTAEMTAGFLAAYCGIDGEDVTRNSAAYLQGWMARLRAEPKILLKAAVKAQKAMTFILEVALEEADDTEAVAA